MGVHTFKLPDIGEGIAEAEIAEWKVSVGDVIVEDQPLCDMLTDKAAVEIPSPVAGKVLELKGAAGDLVAVGGPLVLIEVEGGAPAPEAAASEPAVQEEAADPDVSAAADEEKPQPAGEQGAGQTEPQRAQKQKPEPSPAPRTAPRAAAPKPAAGRRSASGARSHSHLPRAPGEKPLASPAVRQRARELGIELAFVPGSGPAGRITHDDLDAFVERGGGTPAIARAARTGVEEIKVIGLRRKIAEAMQRSKQRIPHFAYVEEVDVTELEKLRQHMNANRAEGQVKLTILPFLMQALVKVVPEFPMVNANYDDEAGVLRRIDALHIGIAAQTDNGLVVPVVHHAETLDIWGMGFELKRLADAARSGTASREELSGSSITISSLGPMGGIVSTPVINAPEVAIVGVNKMVERPMIVNGTVVPRLMMNLSSSFDHRIVDGWDAASFIQRIKSYLEHPATLFI